MPKTRSGDSRKGLKSHLGTAKHCLAPQKNVRQREPNKPMVHPCVRSVLDVLFVAACCKPSIDRDLSECLSAEMTPSNS